MSSINLHKSFKVALAIRGMDKKDLAAKLKVTKQYLSNVASANDSPNGSWPISLAKLDDAAAELGYKLSEFLALGDADE